MTTESLWESVHDALDNGRDPLEDAAVQAHLVEHPEDYVALDRLLTRLGVLASAPDGPSFVEPRPARAVRAARPDSRLAQGRLTAD